MVLPEAVPAIVLVGGVGSRLKPVSGDLPKPMVPIAGRPFLEHLLRFLHRNGVRQVVLSAGYGADAIRGYFGDGQALDLDIRYSVEEELRGTGGAMKLGAAEVAGDRFLVLNGDSFVDVDLPAMLAFHRERGARVTVALSEVVDAGRFGAVDVERGSGIIRGFAEKRRGGAGLINAGVYIIERAVVEAIPPGVVSFEREVLPRLVQGGACGFVTRGLFVDIGIPEDYRQLAAGPERFLAAVL